jgi:hypothetical protein
VSPRASLGKRDLARALGALERFGLLLQHDAALPSFTGIALGEPVHGSWWAHPRANDLYDLLQVFRVKAGGLSAKLVNGKLTFVAKRLWPAVVALGRGEAGWQRDGLSKDAEAVLAYVRKRGALRADQVDFVPGVDVAKIFALLEKRLLVHAESFHSEAGSHHKLLRSWRRWCADVGYAPERCALPRAQAELETAARALAEAGGARARLPW